MYSLQFYHGTKEKVEFGPEYTVAVEVPHRDLFKLDIYNLLGTNIKTIKFKVGFTCVSPKDQYCKKTGRELAESRLEETSFKLTEIVANDIGFNVYFYSGDGMVLIFCLSNNSEKVRLIDASI
jgi:hypothetical protein